MVLNFTVTDKIVCDNPGSATAEQVINYVKCKFDYSRSAVKDMETAIAIFKSASYGNTAECILDSSGCCYMPPEIYKHGGLIQIILYGDSWTANNQRLVSNYIGPVGVYFGQNVVLPIPLPSKYDVFVAEFSNIKTGLDASLVVLDDLIDNFTDIDNIYVDENGFLHVLYNTGETYESDVSLFASVESLSNLEIEAMLN